MAKAKESTNRKSGSPAYRNIGLVVKPQDSQAMELVSELLKTFVKETPQIEFAIEEAFYTQLPKSLQKQLKTQKISELLQKNELCLVVGGDGTILRCTRHLLHGSIWKQARLLGINAGRVGFLTSIHSKQAKKDLLRILQGKVSVGSESRSCLRVEIRNKKKKTKVYHVVNDCVLSKGSLSRIFEFHVYVNQEFLSSYRADGLIVSPPTGSTAYNLAAGGAILEPGIPAVSLTPICPQSFSNKPIVISDSNEISLSLGRHSTDVYLTLDGHTGLKINDDDEIIVTKSEKKVLFAMPVDELQHHFFRSLRQKLNWGMVPR